MLENCDPAHAGWHVRSETRKWSHRVHGKTVSSWQLPLTNSTGNSEICQQLFSGIISLPQKREPHIKFTRIRKHLTSKMWSPFPLRSCPPHHLKHPHGSGMRLKLMYMVYLRCLLAGVIYNSPIFRVSNGRARTSGNAVRCVGSPGT